MTERQNCMTIADMFNHIVHWGYSVLWNSNGIDFIPILPGERASVPPVSLGPSEAWGILVPTLLWWLFVFLLSWNYIRFLQAVSTKCATPVLLRQSYIHQIIGEL